jgi:hypothetical protein
MQTRNSWLNNEPTSAATWVHSANSDIWMWFTTVNGVPNQFEFTTAKCRPPSPNCPAWNDFRCELIRCELRSGRGLLRCGRTCAAVHPEELRRQMLHALQQLGPVRGFAVVLRRVRAGGKQLGLLLRRGLDVLPRIIVDAGRHVLPGWQDMLRGLEHRCVLRGGRGVRRELRPLHEGDDCRADTGADSCADSGAKLSRMERTQCQRFRCQQFRVSTLPVSTLPV